MKKGILFSTKSITWLHSILFCNLKRMIDLVLLRYNKTNLVLGNTLYGIVTCYRESLYSILSFTSRTWRSWNRIIHPENLYSRTQLNISFPETSTLYRYLIGWYLHTIAMIPKLSHFYSVLTIRFVKITSKHKRRRRTFISIWNTCTGNKDD